MGDVTFNASQQPADQQRRARRRQFDQPAQSGRRQHAGAAQRPPPRPAPDQPGGRGQRAGAQLQLQRAARRRASSGSKSCATARRRSTAPTRSPAWSTPSLRTDFDGVHARLPLRLRRGHAPRRMQVTGLVGQEFRRRARQRLALPRLHPPHRAAGRGPALYRDRQSAVACSPTIPPSRATSTADGRATQSPWANLAVVGGPGHDPPQPGQPGADLVGRRVPHPVDPQPRLPGHDQRRHLPRQRHARDRDDVAHRAVRQCDRHDRHAVDQPLQQLPDRALRRDRDRSRSIPSSAITAPTPTRIQPPTINLNAIVIPASNYWNPFGPVTFANGQANPNRIPGLTNVPAAGLPVRLTHLSLRRYRPAGGRRDQLAVALPGRPARAASAASISTPRSSIRKRRRPTSVRTRST